MSFFTYSRYSTAPEAVYFACHNGVTQNPLYKQCDKCGFPACDIRDLNEAMALYEATENFLAAVKESEFNSRLKRKNEQFQIISENWAQEEWDEYLERQAEIDKLLFENVYDTKLFREKILEDPEDKALLEFLRKKKNMLNYPPPTYEMPPKRLGWSAYVIFFVVMIILGILLGMLITTIFC